MTHSQKIITKCDGIITNCDSLVYYKVRWTVITNCDSFLITKCDTVYYNLRQVLQSAMDLLQISTGITKYEDYYKLRQYSVSLLICRVTVFRFKICVNKLNFCFFIIWLLLKAWGLLSENQKWNFARESFFISFSVVFLWIETRSCVERS